MQREKGNLAAAYSFFSRRLPESRSTRTLWLATKALLALEGFDLAQQL